MEFKHLKYKNYKVEFYNNTAIIKWSRKIDDVFDQDIEKEKHRKEIKTLLKDNDVFNKEFILLTDCWPHSYTGLPVKQEDIELYLQFKKVLKTKEKQQQTKLFLDNIN